MPYLGGSLTQASVESLSTHLYKSLKRKSRSGSNAQSNWTDERPASTEPNDEPELKREMLPRHLQMISVAGAFGTGLIISSGTALLRGGPASLLIAYVLMGTNVYIVMTALAEMATYAKMDKGFPGYATRFADPALG